MNSNPTFRETLDRHLRALQGRDLAALMETLPADGLSLITSDGRLVRTTAEFAAMHRDWFASTTWTLRTDVVRIVESPEMAVAVLHLDYRDDPPDRPPVRETSYLTLVFASREGRWGMIHDQNTPIRPSASGAAG
jgi:uncharacterized protein (TIGR02246 family)